MKVRLLVLIHNGIGRTSFYFQVRGGVRLFAGYEVA
jgi:hypothetical protein